MMSNAGGAWDNSKKLCEKLNSKKTDQGKSCVVGDTVGDPFKDTSGPALNILIKLMSMISLTIAPLISKHKDFEGWFAGLLFIGCFVAITKYLVENRILSWDDPLKALTDGPPMKGKSSSGKSRKFREDGVPLNGMHAVPSTPPKPLGAENQGMENVVGSIVSSPPNNSVPVAGATMPRAGGLTYELEDQTPGPVDAGRVELNELHILHWQSGTGSHAAAVAGAGMG